MYTLRSGYAGQVLYVMCGEISEAIVTAYPTYDQLDPVPYDGLAIAPYPQRRFSVVPTTDEHTRHDLLEALSVGGDGCDVLEAYYLRRLATVGGTNWPP